MADDDIDAMLQGEEGTSTPPPGEKKPQGSQGENPEEVEFNSLKGNTQDRVRELVRRAKLAEAEAERMKKIQSPPPPPPQYNPDVTEALNKLDSAGVSTKDWTQKQINATVNTLRYQMELDRLEGKYTGDDGRPKFDKVEYEDYVERHPQYQGYLPEDVYEKMYREELRDWETQKGRQTKPLTTLKPTKNINPEEELTPEAIEYNLKNRPPAEASKWYQDNLSKINTVLGRMTPPEE